MMSKEEKRVKGKKASAAIIMESKRPFVPVSSIGDSAGYSSSSSGSNHSRIVSSEDSGVQQQRRKRGFTQSETQDERAQKKSKSKRLSGKPSRPLSAYNAFYRDERVKWLAEQTIAAASPVTPATATAAEIQDNDDNNSGKGPKSRFLDMGMAISRRWKVLQAHERVQYEKIAEEDKKRYNREMEEYNDRMLRATKLGRAFLEGRPISGMNNSPTTVGAEKELYAAAAPAAETSTMSTSATTTPAGMASLSNTATPTIAPLASMAPLLTAFATGGGVASAHQHHVLQQVLQAQAQAQSQVTVAPLLSSNNPSESIASHTAIDLASFNVLLEQLRQQQQQQVPVVNNQQQQQQQLLLMMNQQQHQRQNSPSSLLQSTSQHSKNNNNILSQIVSTQASRSNSPPALATSTATANATTTTNTAAAPGETMLIGVLVSLIQHLLVNNIQNNIHQSVASLTQTLSSSSSPVPSNAAAASSSTAAATALQSRSSLLQALCVNGNVGENNGLSLAALQQLQQQLQPLQQQQLQQQQAQFPQNDQLLLQLLQPLLAAGNQGQGAPQGLSLLDNNNNNTSIHHANLDALLRQAAQGSSPRSMGVSALDRTAFMAPTSPMSAAPPTVDVTQQLLGSLLALQAPSLSSLPQIPQQQQTQNNNNAGVAPPSSSMQFLLPPPLLSQHSAPLLPTQQQQQQPSNLRHHHHQARLHPFGGPAQNPSRYLQPGLQPNEVAAAVGGLDTDVVSQLLRLAAQHAPP